MALNLERDSVGAVILGDYKSLRKAELPLYWSYSRGPRGPRDLRRVVDALGNPIDGKGPVNAKMTDALEKVAPGVIARQSVDQPVQIGLKAVDAMVPIGRGQRELIIGDRQIGKSAIAVDAIINQKGSGIKCIYVAIGQKASSVLRLFASSKSMALWTTRLWLRQRPLTLLLCSFWHLLPGVQWVSTIGTVAKTH